MTLRPLLLLFAAGLLSFPARAQEESVFGTTKASETALIGILYDLKQDQSRKPRHMNNPAFHKVIDEFLSKGWDESVLNRYYRVTRPLYTTQIFIPLINANAAPKAFGVENIVKPSFWLIHYKGQVSAPSDGEWRFWGDGEEVCSVAVDGQPVLLANWREITTPSVNWKSPEPPGRKVANSHLRAGTWFSLKKGQIIDLDILIGERAGGVFCAFLLIEKKGETYPMQDGHPVFPAFQLAPFDTPQPESTKVGPPILPNGPIWKAIQ
jgi:hypothetical protein